MAGRDQPADAARGLIAGDEALDEELARGADLLAERQQDGTTVTVGWPPMEKLTSS
jgi:hypothetical protein